MQVPCSDGSSLLTHGFLTLGAVINFRPSVAVSYKLFVSSPIDFLSLLRLRRPHQSALCLPRRRFEWTLAGGVFHDNVFLIVRVHWTNGPVICWSSWGLHVWIARSLGGWVGVFFLTSRASPVFRDSASHFQGLGSRLAPHSP